MKSAAKLFLMAKLFLVTTLLCLGLAMGVRAQDETPPAAGGRGQAGGGRGGVQPNSVFNADPATLACWPDYTITSNAAGKGGHQ